MDANLKITSVLSDPTRFYIYQYILERRGDVTVQEIADQFEIHPNVARLHLTKLVDVNMIVSEIKKTGKGGRPSRLYRLSDQLISLQFPFRDFQLLSNIALETLLSFGNAGLKALMENATKYGVTEIEKNFSQDDHQVVNLSTQEKIKILKTACLSAGLYPEFNFDEEDNIFYFKVFNCPFKEVAVKYQKEICLMHVAFLKGMIHTLFPTAKLVEQKKMYQSCDKSCSYDLHI